MLGKMQGKDDVVVNAPVEHLWPLVSDSRYLSWWGPPMRWVQIHDLKGGIEAVDSRRTVHAEFKLRRGTFDEIRREYVPMSRVSWEILADTFGTLKVTRNTGAALELERVDERRTKVTFLFYHDAKGIGRLLNGPVILPQMRRDRILALVSLKKYAEWAWIHGLRADKLEDVPIFHADR